MKTKDIIVIGIFTSVLCIFSVITIPINSIPITLSIFAICFIAVVSGAKKAFFTVMIYIFCGCLGLPVFSGFRCGINVLLGPTGGYITGYLLIAVIVGFCSEKTRKYSTAKRFYYLLISAFLSMIFCYTLGTLQFAKSTNLNIKESLIICVYPFIFFDICKMITAILLADTTKKHLKHIDI